MTEIRWNAAQVPPGTERKMQGQIENTGRGTCVLTYVHGWQVGRYRRVRERPLLPGYVVFDAPTGDCGWGAFTHNAYGERVARVLGPISDEDTVSQLMLAHAMGTYNQIQSRDKAGRFRRKRRRRPRPGKRLRQALHNSI